MAVKVIGAEMQTRRRACYRCPNRRGRRCSAGGHRSILEFSDHGEPCPAGRFGSLGLGGRPASPAPATEWDTLKHPMMAGESLPIPAMEKILTIFTPLVVNCPKHVLMLWAQASLRPRLLKRLPGWRIDHHIIIDQISGQFAAEVDALACNLGFVLTRERDLHAAYPQQKRGIVRPTYFADHNLDLPESALLVRVIQDTFVTDIDRFAADILALADQENFLAGDPLAWRSSWHLPHIRPYGVDSYTGPQGAMLIAPTAVWRRHFIDLPVHHYSDEIHFGLRVRCDGGKLIAIARSWQHRHNCPDDELRQMITTSESEDTYVG